MKQIAIMMKVPDALANTNYVARADVLLSEDRIYYRFATEDTLEDGDLPGLKERYLTVEARIKAALDDTEGTPARDVKVDVFVDNIKHRADITEASLRRLVAELVAIDDVFCFLKGFVQ